MKLINLELHNFGYWDNLTVNFSNQDADNPQPCSRIILCGEQESGKSIINPVFYYVFGLFKIAVIAQQIYFRYKKGYTKDRRFSLLNLAVMSLSIMAKQAITKNRLSDLFE